MTDGVGRKRSAELSNTELRSRARRAATRLLDPAFDGVLEREVSKWLAELLTTCANRIPPKGAGKSRRS